MESSKSWSHTLSFQVPFRAHLLNASLCTYSLLEVHIHIILKAVISLVGNSTCVSYPKQYMTLYIHVHVHYVTCMNLIGG